MFLPQVLKGNPFLAALLALLPGRCPQGKGPFAETGRDGPVGSAGASAALFVKWMRLARPCIEPSEYGANIVIHKWPPFAADRTEGVSMKLVLAIVSKDDSSMVSSALTQEGFPVTKLATTGGFLMAGNTTFISGVEDGQVDQVIDIIRKQSSRRTQIVPSASTMDGGMYTSVPIEVTVGGATIFVLDVDRFEKV